MKNPVRLRGLLSMDFWRGLAIAGAFAVAAGCGGAGDATPATEEAVSATQALASVVPARSQVVVNDDGSAIMLGGTYANRDALVTGWDTAQDLGSNSQSLLVGDGAGNAALITRNGSFVTSARRYVVGQGWTSPFGLVHGSLGSIEAIHAAAFDAAGDLVVVGSANYLSTGRELFVARHSLTAGWSAPAIETNVSFSSPYSDGASAAINQAGDVVVVHTVEQSAHVQTWAERYTRAGGWSSSRLDADPEATVNATPRAALDAAGNATAVWSEYEYAGSTDPFYSANRYNTWWSRFTLGVGWATPKRLITAEKPVGLVADRAGNAMLMTEQYVGPTKAFVRRFSNGAWSQPTQIDHLYALGSRLTGSVNFPSMTLDRQGNATIIWQYLEVDTSLRPHYTLKAQRYAVGYGWQAVYALSPSKLDYGYPSFGVAAGGDAQARVYWTDGTRGSTRRFLRGTGWLAATELLWSTQPAPPSIVSLSVTPAAANIVLSGTPGTTYGVESSTDFTTWRARGAATMNGLGQSTFVDSSSTTEGMSFYRAVWPATAYVNASPCVDIACATP